MINIVFGANFLLGLIAILGVLILYFLRIIRPELSRDEDIFFTTLGLIYGSILIIHGWRLDPILLFSQVLIVSIALAAGWEAIRLRGLIAQKIKEELESPKLEIKFPKRRRPDRRKIKEIKFPNIKTNKKMKLPKSYFNKRK